MFESIMKSISTERENFNNKLKYQKLLGWKEFDEEGNSKEAVIDVFELIIGYAVFRSGTTKYPTLLYHSCNLDETVEWAVDRAKKEISEHEIKQVANG